MHDNENSPNVVNKMRSVHSIETQNKQNDIFVSFFYDINQQNYENNNTTDNYNNTNKKDLNKTYHEN